MTDDHPSAVARVQMAYRVRQALAHQESDVLVTVVHSGDVLSGQDESETSNGDFIVTALDLRVRLLLLVGQASDRLRAQDNLVRAQKLLWSNPDTFACVLVADDDDLTCDVVDSNEFSSRRSSSERSHAMQGPLESTLRSFLQPFALTWDAPALLSRNLVLNLPEVAALCAQQALAERHSSRSPIPERSRARRELDSRDADRAAELALRIIAGEVELSSSERYSR
jgi:hypothetical protein